MMKMSLKLPGFATPKAHAPADAAPDTALIETLLPDDDGGPTVDEARDAAAAEAFAGSSARRRKRFTIPLVGHLPIQKQLQVWLPVLVLSALLGVAFLWLDARQTAETARSTQLLGDALTHSQRLAKAAPNAIAGNVDAFRQLAESRQVVDRSLRQLVDAGVAAPAGVGAPSAVALLEAWRPSDAAAGALLAQQSLLVALAEFRQQVAKTNPQLLAATQVVATQRLQAGASSREVAAAGELVALSQRIARDAGTLGIADVVDVDGLRQAVASLRQLSDALLNGSDRMRISPVGDGEARRSLEWLRQASTATEASLASVMTGIQGLQQARAAERRIFADSETVRGRLESLRDALRGGGGLAMWNKWIAAGSGFIALLALFGLFRAFLSDSEQRAEEAERQRAVAERLEQEAKRANDQNQSAILRLMNELQEVADGDLTIQATVSEDITGAIADSVNYTVEELRSLVSRINATAEMVNEASSKAQMTASSLQAASEQQSREIRETGEAVLRMAQQINEVSARAAESVQVARHSLAASEDGSRAVDNAISGMNGIRDQIQETAKRIKRLGESSQEVGEIVELISDITEQTNVLALNAAIQAASAGEAGRGFTIVAEEVQRLAERSAEATKQIAALIRTIQTDTQDAVAAMERSTQGVVEGTRLSDEAGRALGEIGRVSRHLAELIEDFSNTTSKQAASAGTVAQSIQRILLVTEQTSEGTLHTAGSIRQLSELAQELKSSVSRFKVG
ncbi:methyl-accepting chemotaxis protein [Burkholderiaceae bacterium FT117]|uniref:methyl-accepting chemotaxis protein n=1 Tax=Zeimonas sediminis TaxID=2944268 RepID=UPI002342E73C|nr:methyl-accepting chemotaxis protein [Zeimonas sediminis]MCM5572397.1 methyl-accepting chemotaxis protein [Zeimonas sediminis]